MTTRHANTFRAPTGEVKMERQAGEINDHRRAVEALNALAVERPRCLVDRSARISV